LDKRALRATVTAILLIDGAMYLGGHVHTTLSQRNLTRLLGLLLVR
jgi:hypothetical protein